MHLPIATLFILWAMFNYPVMGTTTGWPVLVVTSAQNNSFNGAPLMVALLWPRKRIFLALHLSPTTSRSDQELLSAKDKLWLAWMSLTARNSLGLYPISYPILKGIHLERKGWALLSLLLSPLYLLHPSLPVQRNSACSGEKLLILAHNEWISDW